MPVTTSGVVGPPAQSATPNTQGNTRLGAGFETIVGELHGKFYEQNYRGNLYIATTAAAGAAVPAFSTAAQQFLVWNPPNSTINVVPIRITIAWVSTTFAAGHFCIGHSLTVQAAPGTATPAVFSFARLGAAAKVGQAQIFTPGSPGTVLTYHSPLPISTVAVTAASTNDPFMANIDCDGMYICPPGGLFSIAGNIALLGVCAISMIY